MIENITIHGPQILNEFDSIVSLTDPEERAAVIEKIKKNDHRWGFDLDKKYHYINNYDNDDYLFTADLLDTVRNIHKLIYFDPNRKMWIRGNSEIPYIHLEFIEKDAVKTDENNRPIKDENGMYIPDDTKLNMGVKRPYFNKTHKLEFNYYWLKQYLNFVQKMFDDNEEFVVNFPSDRPVPEPDYGTKEDLLKLAAEVEGHGLSKQAHALRIYAQSVIDNSKVLIPTLTMLDDTNGTNHWDWGFIDKERKVFSVPMKKGIYNTSGFAALFHNRVDMVADIYIATLEMILAHETAHVARGHWNLRIRYPRYSYMRNVMMNCEIQADHTAMRWLLNELLYDTVTGDPHHNILAYTAERLIYLWSIRIFSAYLSLSWGFREEDRVWSINTIEKFCENREKDHPPYQFRVYSVLCHAKEHLDHMEEQNKKDGYVLKTADGKPLDAGLFKAVWDRTMDMIYSFEASFKMTWENDERDTLQKLKDGLNIADKSVPERIEEIPFMMGYMNRAQAEMAEYEELWPEVLEKLRECGMYFVM